MKSSSSCKTFAKELKSSFSSLNFLLIKSWSDSVSGSALVSAYFRVKKKISDKIQKHTKATVKMNTEIQNLLIHAVQHAEYSEAFLKRYLSTKKLTSVDFAEFYFAHPVAEKLREHLGWQAPRGER